MNNLYQSLNQSQPQSQSNSGNIMSQIQGVMNEVKQSGLTPEQLFYKKAQAQGANIQNILNQANQLASQFNLR